MAEITVTVDGVKYADHPHASDEEIREGLEGNLCRCTGYENIVRAVRRAAEAGVSH
jgi:aerobic carbon-monoxide dehydrogenase small subunit